jgi:aminoglycoside phosphotransferase (APT) family kinase protein
MTSAVDIFQPVLTALHADKSTEFGAPGARVEIVRPIEGSFSSVRRVRIRTPERTMFAYIKILKARGEPGADPAMADRWLKREYRATQAVYEARHRDPRIGAVRPIAWFPEYRAIVTEEVPGRTLGELLAEGHRPHDELAAISESVGAWVRLYQAVMPASGLVSIAERREYLDVRLKRLRGRVLTEADRDETLRRFDQLAIAVASPTVPAVAIHADLSPLNVIVDDTGRLTVIDFTMAKTGTALHDLTHIYFHFELMAARHPARRASLRALQRALLSGYSPALAPDDPLFRLMLLQHGVCHVAVMAERRVPAIDAAYRWFMRRRWRVCDRMTS